MAFVSRVLMDYITQTGGLSAIGRRITVRVLDGDPHIGVAFFTGNLPHVVLSPSSESNAPARISGADVTAGESTCSTDM